MDRNEIVPHITEVEVLPSKKETRKKIELLIPKISQARIRELLEESDRKSYDGLTEAEYFEKRRNKYGQPEHQKLIVSDEILQDLGIQVYIYGQQNLSTNPDYICQLFREELSKQTNDNQFLTFTVEELEAYRVRAGILTEKDQRVIDHEKNLQEKNKQILTFIKERTSKPSSIECKNIQSKTKKLIEDNE